MSKPARPLTSRVTALALGALPMAALSWASSTKPPSASSMKDGMMDSKDLWRRRAAGGGGAVSSNMEGYRSRACTRGELPDEEDFPKKEVDAKEADHADAWTTWTYDMMVRCYNSRDIIPLL